MATPAPKDECIIVIAGRPHRDLAMVANGLLGCNIASEEDAAKNDIVETKIKAKNGFGIKVAILPGIGAMNYPASQIKDRFPRAKIGLIIYCAKVEGRGLDTEGMRDGLEKITDAYSNTIWDNSLFAFLDPEAGFAESDVSRWKNRIGRLLSSMRYPYSANFPVAVVGKENTLNLTNRDFWLSFLWKEAYNRSTKICQEGLLKFVAPRGQKHKVMLEHINDIQPKKIWEQPICSKQLPMKLRAKVALGVTGASAAAAGVVGAGIGATIGAVAIGVVSFGVAAGVGLVLGGLIGGAIGAGTVGGIAGGVAKYKEIKEEEKQEEEYGREIEASIRSKSSAASNM